MADKKITELTELSTVAPEDLLVIVDNPTGTPITKKIRVGSMFSNLTHVTSTSAREALPVGATLVANANTGIASSLLTAARFVTKATTSSGNTEFQYGLHVTSQLDGATANVKNEHASAKFILDVSNSASLSTNTFGAVVLITNTGTRVANTQAFIGFGDTSQTTTAATKYAFDLGLNASANVTANLTTGSGNTSVMFINSTADAAATHKLKVRINGSDYWLLLSSNAA